MKRLEYWKPHIAAWRSGNISAANYCAKENLSFSVFRYWRLKIDAQEKQARKNLGQTTLSFAPIEISQEPIKSPLELITQSGFTIRVNQHFDPILLTKLLECLRGLPC